MAETRAALSMHDGFQIWAVEVSTRVLREISQGERSLNEYPGT